MSRFARLLSFQLFVLLFSLTDVPRAEEDPSFSQRELDRLLAPIALYPDVVLSQVLMAATYPLEIVEAARWSKAHPGLAGADAVAAVEDRDWDASVKALTAFPRLLARMDEDLEWTKRVGDAFLFQQAEVMDTIQDLRRRAYEAGNLEDLEQVRVSVEGDTVLIEPADTEIVYVPYYDTHVVYGGWWWPAYPPYCWTPPVHHAAGGFYYWSGAPYASGLYYSQFSWRRHHVVIIESADTPGSKPGHGNKRGPAAHGGARHWSHDPRHRRGAVYRDRGASQKYGRPRASAGGDYAGLRKEERPRGGQYRQDARPGYAAGFGDGRRKYAGRGDGSRAGVQDGGRPQGKRFVGKRRHADVGRTDEPPRAAAAGRRSGEERDATPPRVWVSRQDADRAAAYYYPPRQAASRTAQAFAPRTAASGRGPTGRQSVPR